LAWADQDTYHPKLYVKSKVEHRTCTPWTQGRSKTVPWQAFPSSKNTQKHTN
jgi:hypothetical protein